MRPLQQTVRLFLFPFFLLRLYLQIAGFLLILSLVSLLPFAASILIIITVGAYLTLLFYPKRDLATIAPPLTSLPLPAELTIVSTAQLKVQNSAEKLRAAKDRWQEYLILQPTHRDLLINLGLIEYYSGNRIGYEKLIDQARRLDPNNKIFVQQ